MNDDLLEKIQKELTRIIALAEGGRKRDAVIVLLKAKMELATLGAKGRISLT